MCAYIAKGLALTVLVSFMPLFFSAWVVSCICMHLSVYMCVCLCVLVLTECGFDSLILGSVSWVVFGNS